jgi:hypothetical protein
MKRVEYRHLREQQASRAKDFISSSLRQVAELTIAAGKVEKNDKDLFWIMGFNTAITEQENKYKEFLK